MNSSNARWFNIFFSLLALVVMYALFQLDALWAFALPGWLVPLAWPLLLAGSGLIFWAAVTLNRQGGASGAPGDPTKYLVDGGPYRWIRNPIYAGDILLVFGLAFFNSSPSVLVAALALPIVVDLYVRKIEEPRTAERLGKPYLDYLQEVPRWFPRRHRRNPHSNIN